MSYESQMVDALTREGSKVSPAVDFNAETGILRVEGRSIPENSADLYDPLEAWIKEYAKNPCKHTVLKLYMHYFNTSSSQGLLRLMRGLEAINEQTSFSATVEWFYESDDDELLESGTTYKDMVTVPWKLVPMSPEFSTISEFEDQIQE